MTKRDNFIRSYDDEPHITRRKAILLKHPEIAELFKPDPRPIPIVLILILSQLAIAYYQRNWSLLKTVIVAYVYGGTCSHTLSLMTHELSHNLVFVCPAYNEYFGMICNIGMGIPSSTTFKRYHMEHHQYQGDVDKDVDIPFFWEGYWFNNVFGKILWLFLQPLFYSIRPMFKRPKTMRPIDLINYIIVIGADIIMIYFWGPRAVVYLVLSTLLGMGLHPVAGHFIAEHSVFNGVQETYSYYGPLNWLCWNVGYHNEHHDFPRVPGWKLPLVKLIAPEFYDMPHHDSWMYAMYRFITTSTSGPFSRVIRDKTAADHKQKVK